MVLAELCWKIKPMWSVLRTDLNQKRGYHQQVLGFPVMLCSCP